MTILLCSVNTLSVRRALLGLLVWGLVPFSAVVEAGPSEGRLLGYLSSKIAHSPDNAELYLRRAYSFAEIGHMKDAFADLRRVERLGRGESANFARGELLRRAGRLEAARRKFDQVLVENPRHYQALMKRAEVLVSLGKNADALADYQRLFQVRPNSASGYYRQAAELYLASGAPEQALALLDTRMAATGPIPQLQNLAIAIEQAQGRYAAAIVRMKALSAASHSSPFWHSKTAALYYSDGDIDRARHHIAIAEYLLAQRRQTPAVIDQLNTELLPLKKRLASQ